MRTKQRSFIFLGLSILLFILLIVLIFFFSPSYHIQLLSLSIPLIPIFLLILFFFLFSLISFLFKNTVQAWLIAGLGTSILIFRLTELTHPLFLILSIALFVILELLFMKRT